MRCHSVGCGTRSRMMPSNTRSFAVDHTKPWIESAHSALIFLKSLKDLLPKGRKRDEAEQLIQQAEAALKRADARIALDMGFPLCRRCWPPEIMLIAEDTVYRCRRCG